MGDDEQKSVPKFVAPVIQDNVNGWGPCDMPEQFKDMPYQPFSKGDRLGKASISDWAGTAFQDKKYINKYQSQFGAGSQYAYYHEEDESTFHLVDTTRVQKPPYQRGRFKQNRPNLRGRGGQRGTTSQLQLLTKGPKLRDKKVQQKKWSRQPGLRNQKNQPPIKNRDASVTVRADWVTIEEMDFPRLAKLSLPNVKEGVDIMCCGSLEYYDKAYDRVNVKNEKPLQRIDRIFHTVTTTDDPIIRKLSKTEGNVYATDAILAAIMCSTRSNYSWDIVIEKIGHKLFFDKRDNTEFDLLTVNETSVEPPQDDGNSFNSPRNLALEATFINHNFSQQVLKTGEPRYNFEEKNPFISEEEEGEVASVAYRYRKWDLDNGIVLIARCEHDAVMQMPNGDIQFLTIKALNEWDSKLSGGVEWRQKLDTQRGAVLANELRNNACKLAKWTVQALLAGSDQIKFGYVSRAHVRDSSKHVILGTQQYKPNEFATQINLNMDNAWGILRCIIDICMKQKEGKYLIMKDPNKPMIRLYDIPDNTFDSEGDEDEDDDSRSAIPESYLE
ncbi:eukaryotic translation initiation factor 3 subunit, putative [Pediculus humanus corporis]|uniref:Eukaryotic translation initiation factor 3 subunit D n=1 Tax=Pediculus humanus subsp. corporis TaxID=121224 RepID=E0VST5_PEDHC|nr:eukaryotic translation initiation factor 3 subunit, putative [Pediculus humanus corporis]EEB16441.1 eukaryotic translation initiation factor 3 subunit, putative [Pediculus humanus corporis]